MLGDCDAVSEWPGRLDLSLTKKQARALGTTAVLAGHVDRCHRIRSDQDTSAQQFRVRDAQHRPAGP